MRRRQLRFTSLHVEPLESRRVLTVLVDLDTDGDLDVVRAHAWYENVDGQGDLAEHVFGSDAGAQVQVGDLDGDGDIDVVTSAGSWYENRDGAGDLGNTHEWNVTAEPFDSFRLHDVDRDADLDIIAMVDREHAALLLNDGTGVFAVESSFTSPFVNVLDFDGDTLLDKLVENDVGFWLYRNQGDGSFEQTQLVIQKNANVEMGVYGIADVDGNGYEDIIEVSHPSFYGFHWLGSDGQQIVGGGPLGVGDGLVLLADMDQDGDLEGVTHILGASLNWKFTEGNGGWRGSVSVRIPEDTFPCLYGLPDAGDVNGDGRLDFACGSGEPIWIDGSTFETHERIEPTPVGDVNGDGVFDSSDLVAVFQAGEYEDDLPMNSNWNRGDWNRDGDFTSADLVFAFQAGSYQASAIGRSNARIT